MMHSTAILVKLHGCSISNTYCRQDSLASSNKIQRGSACSALTPKRHAPQAGWPRRLVRWGPRYQPVFVRPDGLDLELITKLVEEGKMRPVVDRVFKLEDARCSFSS